MLDIHSVPLASPFPVWLTAWPPVRSAAVTNPAPHRLPGGDCPAAVHQDVGVNAGVRGFRGSELRRHRLRAGLTQGQLAQQTGASRSQIAAYEAGRVPPRGGTVQRLAVALGIEPSRLLTPLPRPTLRDVRLRAGHSQQACADALGLSQTSYRALEAGDVVLRDPAATTLAGLLLVDVDQIRTAWATTRSDRDARRR